MGAHMGPIWDPYILLAGLLTAIVCSTSVCYIWSLFVLVFMFADGILDEHTASFCRIKTNPNKFQKRHKHLLIVWNFILNVIGFQL